MFWPWRSRIRSLLRKPCVWLPTWSVPRVCARDVCVVVSMSSSTPTPTPTQPRHLIGVLDVCKSENPGELIRISGEEWTPDRVRTNCMQGCIVMPSAPSSCLFALAPCQLILADGRWGMGPLAHLTTMLNTHALTQAQINAHINRNGWPMPGLLPFNYQLHQKHLHVMKMCLWAYAHVHANRLHPPVTMQPAASCAMYDNKHRVWAGGRCAATREMLIKCLWIWGGVCLSVLVTAESRTSIRITMPVFSRNPFLPPSLTVVPS